MASLAVLASAGCKSRTSPPKPIAPPVNMWKLAPEGTVTTAITTMRGLERLGAAVRIAATNIPELANQHEEGEAPLEDVFVVTRSKSPQKIGLVPDSTTASFRGAWGTIEVWQTTDARRFNAARHGVTRDGVDHFDNDVCKEVRGVYACSEKLENLDLLGNGNGLVPPAVPAGMRPDVVIVSNEKTERPMDIVAAMIEPDGPLVITAQLDEGIALVSATLPGRPRGAIAKLVDAPRHRLRTDGLSGFIAMSLTHLAAAPEPRDDVLVELIAGEAWVPSDGGSAQISVELRDPARVQRGIATCGQDDTEGTLSNDPAHPGECRVSVPEPMALTAVVWVQGTKLRMAGSRGEAQPPPKPLATPPAFGTFLGDRPWTFVAWARGVAATSPARSAGAFGVNAEQLQAVSHLSEMGLAIDVQPDRIDVRAAIRTTHSEPDAVQAAFDNALSGQAMENPERLAAFAKAHPTSRLADDVRAGASGGQVVWYIGLASMGFFAAGVPELRALME